MRKPPEVLGETEAKSESCVELHMRRHPVLPQPPGSLREFGGEQLWGAVRPDGSLGKILSPKPPQTPGTLTELESIEELSC